MTSDLQRFMNVDYKESWCWRTYAFELWCWRTLFRVLWAAGRSNQSILKEISPKYSLEGLMLKLKLQYFGHLMQKLAHWERPWCWEKGMIEDEMVGWHPALNGHKFEQSPGIGDGQGSLVCCMQSMGSQSQTTEQLNEQP